VNEGFSAELQKAILRAVERKAGAAIVREAPLDAVLSDGTVMVRVAGRSVAARMATEEPMVAGEAAWVSQTAEGEYIVHGGANA